MTGAYPRRQTNPLLGDSPAAGGSATTHTTRSTATGRGSASSSHSAVPADSESHVSVVTRLFQLVAWLNFAAVVAVWAAMCWGTDYWWWATVLAYMPRWMWSAPLAVFIVATLVRPRRFWLVTLLTSVWVAWPLMGLCLSWPSAGQTRSVAAGGARDGLTARVVTCNVGTAGFDPLEMAALVAETSPDLIALEENVSAEELSAAVGPDWHVAAVHELAVASRWPIVDSERLTWPAAYGPRSVALRVRCRVPASPSLDSGPDSNEEETRPADPSDDGSTFDLVVLHLCTPRKGLEAVKMRLPNAAEQMEANTELRDAESTKVRRWIEQLPGPVIVAGDMNMPPESGLFHRDWSQFADAFATAGWGYGYTYGYTTSGWFYGIRIDHILADADWQVERCWLGRHVGSDHRPVVADLRRR